MNKTTIISRTKLAIISLLVFGFVSCNSTAKTDDLNSLETTDIGFADSNFERSTNKKIPDLYYGVDTRFTAVKKSDIDKATTIYDFLNEEEKQQIDHINSVKLVIIKNNQQSDIQDYGKSDQLTEAQLKILRSTDFFSHFTIRTEFKEKNKETGKLEDHFFGPHITVVPDKQAAYIDGKESLIAYLKRNSNASMTAIKDDILGAIKISFLVTKEGIISNIIHDAMTTGYSSIDQKLLELIKNIPGEWTPAENSLGEKIDYEFVFTFGPRDGC
jgi:hypothetical protein